MIYRLTLTIYLWLLTCSFGISSNNPLFFSGSLEELITLSEIQNRPYIVLFSKEWSPSSNQMEKAFEDNELAYLIEKSFIVYKANASMAFHPRLKEYEVNSYPTILVFYPNGRLVSKLEGNIPSELLAVNLERIAINLHDPLPSVYLPLEEEYSIEKVAYASEEAGRGKNKKENKHNIPNNHYGQKPIVEDQTFDLGDFDENKPFSLRIKVYYQKEDMLNDLDKIQHVWKEQFFVYSDYIGKTKRYHLLLGAFPDQSTADYYAYNIKDLLFVTTELVNLNVIRNKL